MLYVNPYPIVLKQLLQQTIGRTQFSVSVYDILVQGGRGYIVQRLAAASSHFYTDAGTSLVHIQQFIQAQLLDWLRGSRICEPCNHSGWRTDAGPQGPDTILPCGQVLPSRESSRWTRPGCFALSSKRAVLAVG